MLRSVEYVPFFPQMKRNIMVYTHFTKEVGRMATVAMNHNLERIKMLITCALPK
jgi:hypothetical protein